MKNTTTILKGLLENAEVQCDLNLDRGSIEIEDTNYYLYAVVGPHKKTKGGYDLDVTFARKTSQDVSSETLEILPLAREQESEIANFILEEMDKQELINNNHLYI